MRKKMIENEPTRQPPSEKIKLIRLTIASPASAAGEAGRA